MTDIKVEGKIVAYIANNPSLKDLDKDKVVSIMVEKGALTQKEAQSFAANIAETTKPSAYTNSAFDMGIKITSPSMVGLNLEHKTVQPATVKQSVEVEKLTTKETQDLAIDYLSQNVQSAIKIYNSSDNGVITSGYDALKNLFDTELSSKNVGEVLDKEVDGLSYLTKAKEGTLTKKEYYEANKTRLVGMLMKRYEETNSTGVMNLEIYRGKYSKEQFAQMIEKYIDRQLNNSESPMKAIKDLQHNLIMQNEDEKNNLLKTFAQSAIENNKVEQKFNNPSFNTEGQKQIKILLPKHDNESNSEKLITFEEVFELERGTFFSEEFIERLQQSKGEMNVVVGAHNKVQQFRTFTKETLEQYKKDTTVYRDHDGIAYEVEQSDPNNRAQEISDFFQEYYSISGNLDAAKKNMESLIKKQNLNLSIKSNEDGTINIEFGELYKSDKDKNNALNTLIRVGQQEQDDRFNKLLGGKTFDEYLDKYQTDYQYAFGKNNVDELAKTMEEDQQTVIRTAGTAVAMSGMVVMVVGGVLTLFPATTAAGIGMLSGGGNMAIGGLALKNGLGLADEYSKANPNDEKLDDLYKELGTDAAFFAMGMGAGTAGAKVGSQLLAKGTRPLQALIAERGVDAVLSACGSLLLIDDVNAEGELLSVVVATVAGLGRSKAIFNNYAPKPDTPFHTENNIANKTMTMDAHNKVHENVPAGIRMNNESPPPPLVAHNAEGKLELTPEGDKRVREAAVILHQKYVDAESSIVKNMQDVGLLGKNRKTMTHRAKKEQGLYDKMKNDMIKDKNPATFEDAFKSIYDGVGTRTQLDDLDLSKHKDLKKLFLKDPQKALHIAAERQTAPYVEKIVKLLQKQALEKSPLTEFKISNYMGRDGIPYISEKQINLLRKVAEANKVDLIVKNEPVNIRESGYTAFQMNFKNSDGTTFEWQLRGSKVNKYAEEEHVAYDAREKKDLTGDNPLLKPLYSQFEDIIVNKMSPEEFARYNEYLTDHYKYLRKGELGVKSRRPNLEQYGNYDNRLSAKSLEHLHDIAVQLKDNKITLEQALDSYKSLTTHDP